jgi:ADP-ribose pyrophosphatase
MSHTVVDKQTIFAGSRVRLEVHTLADDATGKRMAKEVVVHPGAVVILPLMSDGTVVLIRNRRYAVGQVLTELPAGTLEPGEEPMNCAGRELVEETGFIAGRLKRLNAFYASPGIISERLYCFAAFDLEPAAVDLDEGEEIEVVPTPFADCIEMIRDGTIQDGKTIATLLFYDKFYRSTGHPPVGP